MVYAILCLFSLLELLQLTNVEGGATTTSACADQVPLQEVRRGKGAFYSGCDQLGGEVPTGCWTPGQYRFLNPGVFGPENDNYGCQTCVIQEDWAKYSLFNTFWGSDADGTLKRDKMVPCPTSFQYGSAYQKKFGGAIDVVTGESVWSADKCGGYPDGTFYNKEEDRCYFKSTRYSLSNQWDEAVDLCTSMGGALVGINSEAENDWFAHNLLWIGFMGETFTGLFKYNADQKYQYAQSDAIEQPKTFDAADVNSWYGGEGPWYPEMDEKSSYGDINVPSRTCVEFYPDLPKGWNPFSCDVNKQYACELPPGKGGVKPLPTVPAPAPVPNAPTPATTPTPTPTPTTPTTAPVPNKTKAPVATPPTPTPKPTPVATPITPGATPGTGNTPLSSGNTPPASTPAPADPSLRGQTQAPVGGGTPSDNQGGTTIWDENQTTGPAVNDQGDAQSGGDGGSDGNSSSDFSTAAIVGIAVGSAVLVGGVALVIKKKNVASNKAQPPRVDPRAGAHC